MSLGISNLLFLFHGRELISCVCTHVQECVFTCVCVHKHSCMCLSVEVKDHLRCGPSGAITLSFETGSVDET